MKRNIVTAILVAAFIFPATSIAQEKMKSPFRTEHYQQVVQGKLFTVTLRSNSTTGYTWILRTLPSRISLVSADYRQSESCKSGMTGCGGEEIFTFRAENNGSGTIELYYVRPWEKTIDNIWYERVDIVPPLK